MLVEVRQGAVEAHAAQVGRCGVGRDRSRSRRGLTGNGLGWRRGAVGSFAKLANLIMPRR